MTVPNRTMSRRFWSPVAAMSLAALLALWLLWRPDLLSALPMAVRLPLIALGIWALGSGFMHGVGLEARRGWARRLSGPPGCWLALGIFSVVLLVRAWWLA